MLDKKTILSSNNDYVNSFQLILEKLGLWDVPSTFHNSTSWYQALKYVLQYLVDKVVPGLVTNDEQIKQLYQYYQEVVDYCNDYFENLDVQEEINNKLDEMAENGTLQEIIYQFINSNCLWTFDNVEDMKNGSNLIAGSFAKILGYYEKNDGGEGLYFISTTENNEFYQIKLNNNLYANLIIKNQMNVKCFGVKDNEENNENFQKAFNYCKNLIMKNGNYRINIENPLQPLSNTKIEILNCVFNAIPSEKGNTPNNRTMIFNIENKENIYIDFNNSILIGEKENHSGLAHEWSFGIRIMSSKNITIKNAKAQNWTGDGFVINGNSENIILDTCYTQENHRNGLSVGGGKFIYINNCQFENLGKEAEPKAAIDIEPDPNQFNVNHIYINNCRFLNSRRCILAHDLNYNDDNIESVIKNVYINNCKFFNDDNSTSGGITLQGIKDSYAEISNCEFDSMAEHLVIQKSKYIKIYNNIFKNSTYWGIELLNSSNIDIDNNIIENSTDIALNIRTSSYNNIINNIFRNNFKNAIYIQRATPGDETQFNNYNNISNNIFINNNRNNETLRPSLYIIQGANYNIIANNDFTKETMNLRSNIENTSTSSINNIYKDNIMNTQSSTAYDIRNQNYTLFNIIDNVLEKGNMFTE